MEDLNDEEVERLLETCIIGPNNIIAIKGYVLPVIENNEGYEIRRQKTHMFKEYGKHF